MSNTPTKKKKTDEGSGDAGGMVGIAMQFVSSLSVARLGKHRAAANLYKQAMRVMRAAVRLKAHAIVNSTNMFKEVLGAKLAKVTNGAANKAELAQRPTANAAARAGLSLKT